MCLWCESEGFVVNVLLLMMCMLDGVDGGMFGLVHYLAVRCGIQATGRPV